MKKILIAAGGVLLLTGAAVVLYFLFFKGLKGHIVMPYITHQKPLVDPHVQSSVPIADKLDEVVFDGLFNVSANPSGITYEDGLGEYMGITPDNVVSVRLKPRKAWHSSFEVAQKKDQFDLSLRQLVLFTAKDLKFTLRRIGHLGSVSPDYILVHQAVQDFDFSGPDENGEIRFQFRGDRIWSETDIKEVLSFKVLPANAEVNAPEYRDGTGPYLRAGEYEEQIFFRKTPEGAATIERFNLRPYIDNSTYTTELRNRNINALLSVPFGGRSPILEDSVKYFCKSSISTAFFALFYNTQKLDRAQRRALRALVNNRKVMIRFFRMGTEQQRHILNYKGENDNYEDYLNYSLFPSTSYYVEEKVVNPLKTPETPDLSVLPDTVRIQTCLSQDFREELSELAEILSDPAVTGGKVKVSAVQNDEIRKGNYDAVLLPVTGYRSNFLFDLYTLFLREPDFEQNRISLMTLTGEDGKLAADERSLAGANNFFRIDLSQNHPDLADFRKLLEYAFGFMSTSEIGDKQVYAQMIDQLDQELALGSWLFSLPSLAYFNTQFDASTVDLYGTASQLSTIEKWKEKK